MKFTKMHGIGNDYVYVNLFEEEVTDAPELAKRVSVRHFGVGSDGLILIAPSEKADFRMIMYNADGSEGAMCGNGIRCVGKYVYDHKLTGKTDIAIETRAGIRELKLNVDADTDMVETVRVNMGEPVFESEKIPTTLNNGEGRAVDCEITVAGEKHNVTCVSMGNPHCVVFMDTDVKKLELVDIGEFWERHKAFPDRINTEFVNVIDRKTLSMRVWERGSGETLACGTGACATAVAAVLNKLTDNEVMVKLIGGDLTIRWDGEGNPVYMTGPATEVFRGEI